MTRDSTTRSAYSRRVAKNFQGPSKFALMMLRGLQRKHVYQGTVDPAVVRRRRARNRVASKSRRINRSAS